MYNLPVPKTNYKFLAIWSYSSLEVQYKQCSNLDQKYDMLPELETRLFLYNLDSIDIYKINHAVSLIAFAWIGWKLF